MSDDKASVDKTSVDKTSAHKNIKHMKRTPIYFLFNLLVFFAINVSPPPVYAGFLFSDSEAIETEETKASSPTVTIKFPPASLEQWYKPANKRQVWLHTMFRLRREMQAIAEYAKTDHPDDLVTDKAVMQKWVKRLEKDYNKIAEMVPEWKDDIKSRLLSELEMFVEKGDGPRIGKTLEMIERTCDDCHTYYQPLVTAMYRSPHYDDIEIKNVDGSLQSFEDNMEQLSDSVNRILIALEDGRKPSALTARTELADQLQKLGSSCNGCHKDDEYPRERILGKATQQRFETLQKHIEADQVKDSQKLMGEIAVTVCARCHNTHRIVNDLRNALLPDE